MSLTSRAIELYTKALQMADAGNKARIEKVLEGLRG